MRTVLPYKTLAFESLFTRDGKIKRKYPFEYFLFGAPTGQGVFFIYLSLPLLYLFYLCRDCSNGYCLKFF